MFVNKLLYLAAAVIATTKAAAIPSYIHICRQNDPDVSKCILESIETLRPKLKNGIPELDVPALEPLRLDNIVFSVGGAFTVQLKDINIYGLSNFTINKLKLDVPNHIHKISVSFPQLRFVGQHEFDIKLLAFPLQGSGRFDANATKCDGTAIMEAGVAYKDNIKRLYFKNIDLELKIADYQLHLGDLFGDEDLSTNINQLINQHKVEILAYAKPYLSKKAAELILNIANKIVQNFSYDEVFPEK